MSSKKMLVSALATAAFAWPAAAPASPADQGPPPPPSSIAISAADEYEQLRASTGAAQDLRSPDTRDQAAGYAPTLQQTAADDGDVSPGGFDAVSGALGAAAGIGLAIAAVALAGGLAGMRSPRRA